jgi:hypothetical protein
MQFCCAHFAHTDIGQSMSNAFSPARKGFQQAEAVSWLDLNCVNPAVMRRASRAHSGPSTASNRYANTQIQSMLPALPAILKLVVRVQPRLDRAWRDRC